MKALMSKLFLIVILGAFVVVFIAMLNPAKADAFGTYCIDINGTERCTIWQWDSKAQRMIKKDIIRSTRSTK